MTLAMETVQETEHVIQPRNVSVAGVPIPALVLKVLGCVAHLWWDADPPSAKIALTSPVQIYKMEPVRPGFVNVPLIFAK